MTQSVVTDIDLGDGKLPFCLRDADLAAPPFPFDDAAMEAIAARCLTVLLSSVVYGLRTRRSPWMRELTQLATRVVDNTPKFVLELNRVSGAQDTSYFQGAVHRPGWTPWPPYD